MSSTILLRLTSGGCVHLATNTATVLALAEGKQGLVQQVHAHICQASPDANHVTLRRFHCAFTKLWQAHWRRSN